MRKKLVVFLLLFSFPFSSANAYWVWSPEAGKFVNTETGAQDAADEQYEYALKLYKDKNYDQAEEQFLDILKKNPNAKVAAEAQYRLGILYEEKKDFRKASKAYRNLIDTYPQSERFNEVVEREFDLGMAFFGGQKGRLMGLNIVPALPQAVEIFDHIVKQAPYSAYGDKAQFQLGLTHKKAGAYGKAAEAFQGLIDQYPQSPLITQSRYELAESSFLRSTSEFRDQRALDEASTKVDSFLKHFPDSEASERAAKIRQEIDEKNAEKNYRIGLYYEKENFLESALIYYQDVSKKYPQTLWGQKSADKLHALKDPTKFIKGEQLQVQQQIEAVEAKLKAGVSDSADKGQLEREVERLQKRSKGVDKDKKDSLKRRQDDLKRRENELKEKFKNLEAKKKLGKKNPSEDFQRALDRWNASLMDEQDQLEKEKQQLREWHSELGVKESKSAADFIPFMGGSGTEVDKVREIEAKKMFKLSEERKAVLDEKETLYRQHGEVATLLGQVDLGGLELNEDNPQVKAVEAQRPELKEQREKTQQIKAEIARLENEIEEKRVAYEKQFGESSWKSVVNPSNWVSGSKNVVTKSVSFLNPFDDRKDIAKLSSQQLAERQMHLREQITTQQSLVDTLGSAFDSEMALQEQKRLLGQMQNLDNSDPRAMRKEIKGVEREMRSRYQEIEDRHKRKKELLAELKTALKENEDRNPATATFNAATRPVRSVGRLGKAFLFGLEDEAVTLTKSADRVSDNAPNMDQIKSLEEKIKFESLMIAAKDQEINKLRKKMQILKAKASLSGGYKFRSSMVSVPYLFIGEAIENAKKIIPEKTRQDMIIKRLDQETQKLEALKSMEKEVSDKLATDGATSDASKTQQSMASEELTLPKADDVQKGQLQGELKSLSEKVREKRDYYREQAAALQSQYGVTPNMADSEKAKKAFGEKEEKLQKELGSIEEEIVKLIRKEQDLQKEENQILEKRISHVEKISAKVKSRITAQDLVNEKDHMEERISQISLRRDFLNKELERFQPTDKKGAAQ